MATFKNINIKMKGGKSRLQRVKVLASGKYKFVKNLTKRAPKALNPSASKKPGKVKRKMAKKKKRASRKMTIPLAAVGGALAGLVIPAATSGGGHGPIDALLVQGNYNWAMEAVIENYTGMNVYTGQWNILNARGLTAAIAGMVGHKIASALGINRTLAASKVPFLRI